QEAAYRTDQLQTQADAAFAVAEESGRRASQMAAQLARPGNSDPTANLVADAENADTLLLSLEMSGKVSSQITKIYNQATQDRNSAQAQADAAEASRVVREELRIEAEEKFAIAQEA